MRSSKINTFYAGLSIYIYYNPFELRRSWPAHFVFELKWKNTYPCKRELMWILISNMLNNLLDRDFLALDKLYHWDSSQRVYLTRLVYLARKYWADLCTTWINVIFVPGILASETTHKKNSFPLVSFAESGMGVRRKVIFMPVLECVYSRPFRSFHEWTGGWRRDSS